MHLTTAEIAASFNRWYKEGNGSSLNKSHKLVLKRTAEFKRNGIETILDIGCGRGLLMEELSLRGFTVSGTEIASYLFSRDLKGHHFYPYSMQQLGKVEEIFDLVLLVDVLEYLKNEKEREKCLEHADRLSKKCVIAIHNGDLLLENWK